MSAALAPETAAAYAHCEALTRAQAANFYYGIRLLSAERRRAMCAVYAFSREVDDIGDDDNGLAAEEKLRLLDAREAALARLEGGRGRAMSATVPAAAAPAGATVPEPKTAPAAAGVASVPGTVPAPGTVPGATVPATPTPTAPVPATAGVVPAAAPVPAAADAPRPSLAGDEGSPTGRRAPVRLAPAAPAGGNGRVSAGAAPDPVIVALADACERFPIPVEALRELVEGVRMDVREVRYERFDELVLYCRRVAGTIGRVCLAIFALRCGTQADRAAAEALADDLGVALQLTNILRDVREDAENGRVYLPFEDLRRFGLLGPAGAEGADGEGADGAERLVALARAAAGPASEQQRESVERMAELTRFEAARAREWFARGGRLAPLLDRRSAACLLAMAGIYARLLDRIEARPRAALARRMSLPPHEKAWVALRGLLGVGL